MSEQTYPKIKYEQGHKFTVNKLDAARRQTKTAIKLWFADADPVSVCTLAYAGHEIIHKIYRKRGLSDLLFDSIIVKDDHRKEYALFLKKGPNFFKHADRDSDQDSLEFFPGLNDIFLMMSVAAIQRMGYRLNLYEWVLSYWFTIRFPTADYAKDFVNKGGKVDFIEDLGGLNKQKFFGILTQAMELRRQRGLNIDWIEF